VQEELQLLVMVYVPIAIFGGSGGFGGAASKSPV